MDAHEKYRNTVTHSAVECKLIVVQFLKIVCVNIQPTKSVVCVTHNRMLCKCDAMGGAAHMCFYLLADV